ncbi:MAG TPA: DUF4261 domain-containing protein [Leptospiraceae bacterium]|nr:DUF4261 domain-containing protein [Leptospiraceae bacterium]HMW04254.1 DUF4261 domain-containing protein [Leptospiraceae bacterium]HMX30600.1 DUF4261 domain-containing protein [Leptospiraceae bacterium]HMY31300.1 DUF4261 domain-containing protein [Leptospiraceae bacterium]HMZ63413.1 DUF4261 domain-containing protein [Leptospiraceae bacterium]
MIKLIILFIAIFVLIFSGLILIYRGSRGTYKTTLTGIILLEDDPLFNSSIIQRELETKYKMKISKQTSNDGIVIFTAEKYRIVILGVDAEIPKEEMETVAKMSHIWQDAEKQIAEHLSHLIITVSTNVEDLVEANMQFTQILASVLRNTKSIGVYLGNQCLVSPKEYFLKIADTMTKDDLPLNNWIYFGLRENNGKRNGFTIGMKEFGFREIEFLNSDKTFDEIYKIIYDLAHHVLLSRKPLKRGETFDLSATENLSLDIQAGEFQDTESMHVITNPKISSLQ